MAALGWLVNLDFAGSGAEAPVVEVSSRGGRSRRRRYVAEVEGEFFVFDSISAVQAFLMQVREEADNAAERDVTTPVAPKPPRVTVKTGAGKATTSKVLQRDIRRTQQAVIKSYNAVAERIRQQRELDAEISRLLQAKLQTEQDEEDAILVLLL